MAISSSVGAAQELQVRWDNADGTESWVSGELHDATLDNLVIWVNGEIARADLPSVGQPIRVHIPHPTGLHVMAGRVDECRADGVIVVNVADLSPRERRRFARARLSSPISTAQAFQDDGQPTRRFAIRLINISAGGVRFKCHWPLRRDDRVQVFLKIDARPPISPIVTIIESTPEDDGSPDGASIRYTCRGYFSLIDHLERKRIGTYVDDRRTVEASRRP